HLVCHILDGVPREQDISVFGVKVTGHDMYTLGLTAGEVNEGGATVTEPVVAYPYIVQPSAGNDAFGPVCGAQFVSYDLDAGLNGQEPPMVELTTTKG